MKRALAILAVLLFSAALARAIVVRLAETAAEGAGEAAGRPPAPVAVAPVERGALTLRRTFSGALEPTAELVVAPRISGRIERVLVELGDPVERGQLVCQLDDAELVQAVHQAEADLAVARADQQAAKSAVEIAERALARARTLRAEGVASESQLDLALADELSARAEVELAAARIPRAQAALEAAEIRLEDSRVRAAWSEGDSWRVVAERLVDEGDTVSANTPLFVVVEPDPVLAVVFVPERDYGKIAVGQRALLTTDAHPAESFEARVARIAPVFRRETRQARVELSAPNPDERLKPGMFVRATLELGRVEDAVIVPFEALTTRGEETGVFVLDETEQRVRWRPVELGVREGGRQQVVGPGVAGQVVVLGQELCEDGGRVLVPDAPAPAAAGRERAAAGR